MGRQVHRCQHGGKPGAFGDTRRQHHERGAVSDDLVVQTQFADQVDDNRGVLTVDREDDFAAAVRNAPVGQSRGETAVHRRGQRATVSVDDGNRSVFQHHRVHVVRQLREFPTQFGVDATRNEHDRQPVSQGLFDRRQGFRCQASGRCQGAVQIQRDHFEECHGRVPDDREPEREGRRTRFVRDRRRAKARASSRATPSSMPPAISSASGGPSLSAVMPSTSSST